MNIFDIYLNKIKELVLSLNKDNSIQILEIQKEGKKKLSLDEFLSGNQIKSGENIH